MKNVSKKQISMKYAILIDFMAYTKKFVFLFPLNQFRDKEEHLSNTIFLEVQ